MDRAIIYDEEQARTYDVLWSWRYGLIGLAFLEQDIAGQTTGVVAGLAASATGPASLTVNLAAGRIYQQTVMDATAYGALASDSDLVMQQGFAAAQSVLLTTSGLSSGQSRWALIQAQFGQVDAIPGDDPTGGLLKYFNSADPTVPFEGPGGDGQTQNTVRRGVAAVNVIYGAPATTGSEVPPSASAGFIGLYLIDLTFGQTQVTGGNILVAGPSVGTGVPSNYPQAPFLAGLLNKHHTGLLGAAPKIDLPTETQGVLPANQLPNLNLSAGQCRLSVVSTTQLKLAPFGGNNLTINGAVQQIAAAGLTAGNTGVFVNGVGAQSLSVSSAYYVYAFMNSGVMTLDFWDIAHSSTPAHVPDTTTGNVGVEVRNAGGTPDSTRTLIAQIATDGSAHFVDSAVSRTCINWFNRRDRMITGGLGSSTTKNSQTLSNLGTGSDVQFLCWGDEVTYIKTTSGMANNTNNNSASIQTAIDGATTGASFNSALVAGVSFAGSAIADAQYSEGVAHVGSIFGAASTGSISTFTNFYVFGAVRG